MTIRLVTFDALHTIVTPRLPIYVQYSQTFEPYLGVLEPEALKKSFKIGAASLPSIHVECHHNNRFVSTLAISFEPSPDRKTSVSKWTL